jgi:VCBS repeat-containing protein
MARINGTNGDNTIHGTGRNDDIRAKKGDDWVDAGDGNDMVRGGAGDDTLIGGAGADKLYGGSGDDVLMGDGPNAGGGSGSGSGRGRGSGSGSGSGSHRGSGSGSAEVSFNDYLNGGSGDDTVLGQLGNDTVKGGSGNDFLDGGVGRDHVDGDSGDDVGLFVGGENGGGYVGTFAAVINGSDIDWTFTVNDAAVDYLGVGETLVQSYDVTVDDGNGGTDTETVTITITGTNDAPSIGGGSSDTDGGVTELVDNAPGENIDDLTDSGVIKFADSDLTDGHTLSFVANGAGYLGTFNAAIARARQNIGESEIRITELRTEQVNEVVAELREVEIQLLDLQERYRAAEDVLKRIEIVSPNDGFVVDLQVFTTGGVIRPGDRLLDIVPGNNKLVIEARVAPVDIDIVRAGLDAQVRLSAFNQRVTPTVDGTVTWVSADRLTDSNSGEEYYTARVDLKDQNDPRLTGLKLQPGMPAEVLIRTGERTLIQYLVSPVEQSISRSLRE